MRVVIVRSSFNALRIIFCANFDSCALVNTFLAMIERDEINRNEFITVAKKRKTLTLPLVVRNQETTACKIFADRFFLCCSIIKLAYSKRSDGKSIILSSQSSSVSAVDSIEKQFNAIGIESLT